MTKLLWSVGSSGELAQLLSQAKLQESAAVSNSTVYCLSHDNRDKIAVSLPNGQVLIIEPDVLNRPRRRRAEPTSVDTSTPRPSP
jgi:hypothetical protein